MIDREDLLTRFFRYVKIDTQSAEEQEAQPSTKKQHDLAAVLYEELQEMGIDATYDKEHCYVYAVLPGEAPTRAKFLRLRRRLMTEDLPTLDLPANTTDGTELRINCFGEAADLINSALFTFSICIRHLYSDRDARFS